MLFSEKLILSEKFSPYHIYPMVPPMVPPMVSLRSNFQIHFRRYLYRRKEASFKHKKIFIKNIHLVLSKYSVRGSGCSSNLSCSCPRKFLLWFTFAKYRDLRCKTGRCFCLENYAANSRHIVMIKKNSVRGSGYWYSCPCTYPRKACNFCNHLFFEKVILKRVFT